MHETSNHWALIIGASGGIGLAAAEKLAKHGMNLFLVHRDRRKTMEIVSPAFEALRSHGVTVVPINRDALGVESRERILETMKEHLGPDGKVRLVLHSLALGNLKLLVGQSNGHTDGVFDKLAEKIGCNVEAVKDAAKSLFAEGDPRLFSCMESSYPQENFLNTDDFSQTIHAMGVNIVEWVQALHQRGHFAEDARVLTLTSEGNSTAWKGYAAVSAAKAVLESLCRSMAVEFGPYGIRSNVIQAGVTDTAALRMIPGNEVIKAHAQFRNPLGRLTTPEDVADVIYLLSTDEASWINGAVICVDGGERIG
jgi:NAD(P)-dependent dehydrogenase (short-subunit alcohol dehydrogenase family)